MIEYQRGDSNPHVLNGHWILSPARLPIPPLWQSLTRQRVELDSHRRFWGRQGVACTGRTGLVVLALPNSAPHSGERYAANELELKVLKKRPAQSVGGTLKWYKLTRDGVAHLHATETTPPPRSRFEDIPPSRLEHTRVLAEVIVPFEEVEARIRKRLGMPPRP